MSFAFRDGHLIDFNSKPYIVAELNTSHFGSTQTAKEMILSAHHCGCDCVKLQSWSPHSLYTDSYLKDNHIAARFYKKLALSESQISELYEYSLTLGISLSSTPYTIDEAKFLVSLPTVPFIKIASMEITNIPYLTQLAQLEVPLVLSTGMSSFNEISDAVQTILTYNNKLVVLHCTSLYPTPVSQVNLRNLTTLSSMFPELRIGFSDHTLGSESAIASVALGAVYIEKHFTVDSSKIGFDNQMAVEAPVMQHLVESVSNAYTSLGSSERHISDEESKQALDMRRSIHAGRYLPANHIISESDLIFRRPGTGISPSEVSSIVGKKICNDISAGDIIHLSDFYPL